MRRSRNATFTSPIRTGTSTSGPITAAKATPEPIPKNATATAIAGSKFGSIRRADLKPLNEALDRWKEEAPAHPHGHRQEHPQR